MHKFVGKLNDSFDRANKFFGVSIQRPKPSHQSVRKVSMIGTLLGMLIVIIGIIGGYKWAVTGGSLVIISNLVNLFLKGKSY